MPEYAYKMFNKDLTCTLGRGRFQYEPGRWYEEPEANCVKNGFHCAKNPLDCLSYYPNWKESACWLVQVDGDIDEDARDSKISCTRIRLCRQLSLADFVLAACQYIIDHPMMPAGSGVAEEKGQADRNGFVICRGKDPAAKGKKGDIIALLQEGKDHRIEAAGMYIIDGTEKKQDTYYGVDGSRRGSGRKKRREAAGEEERSA